jgi:Family of unknown function (DUF6677)
MGTQAAKPTEAKREPLHPLIAVVAGLAGWIVPGLGHVVLGRWVKAAIYFVAVAGLAVAGMRMRGEIFHSSSTDAFGVLGFLADAGNGIFYFLGDKINSAGPDVSRAAGDYGTRLIASAGVLNLLCVLEAFELGLHRHGSERP